MEEERRQVLAMSLSTAERYLRTQQKPRLHGLSITTPGLWGKAQIPVRIFSPWEEKRPGFVEIDLVAHCGDHLDGNFLYTLTLTDLATGWTECIPVLEKSANAVLAALEQARTLFPFPLLGFDTDSGWEFLNAEVIAYCEQEQLTLLRHSPSAPASQLGGPLAARTHSRRSLAVTLNSAAPPGSSSLGGFPVICAGSPSPRTSPRHAEQPCRGVQVQ